MESRRQLDGLFRSDRIIRPRSVRDHLRLRNERLCRRRLDAWLGHRDCRRSQRTTGLERWSIGAQRLGRMRRLERRRAGSQHGRRTGRLRRRRRGCGRGLGRRLGRGRRVLGRFHRRPLRAADPRCRSCSFARRRRPLRPVGRLAPTQRLRSVRMRTGRRAGRGRRIGRRGHARTALRVGRSACRAAGPRRDRLRTAASAASAPAAAAQRTRIGDVGQRVDAGIARQAVWRF